MKNNKKSGISLIVLVITIIVMIILATAIILSISNSGIIPKANEATFKTDMQSYKEAYELYVINNTAKTGGEFNEGSINAENGDEVITEIFGNVPEKYKAGLKIKDGQIIYETEDEKELEIIKEIGMYDNTKIDFKAYLNGPVKISCPQDGLSCKGESDASFASSCNLPNVSTALSLTSGNVIGIAKPTKKGTDNLTYGWVKATDSDYFHKTFSIKCDWENGGQIYLAGIKAKNADSTKPITSSIIYKISTSKDINSFNIVNETNSNKEYVLPTGIPGYVIDISYVGRPGGDGTTVPFIPWTAENFANYDSTTKEASLTPGALMIANVNANSTVEVEIYIYIEAGLENFGWNLDRSSFSDVELTFVGIPND